MRRFVWAVLLAAAAMMPMAAEAQSNIATQSETLTFTGTVDPNIANSIQIRQADGSYSTYMGTFPGNFPYQPNQPVTISMQANVPTLAGLQTLDGVRADGLYPFEIYQGATTVPGGKLTSAPVISGGLQFSQTQAAGINESVSTAINMVYNANTGQYSLAGGGGQPAISLGGLVGAAFTYDPATATVSTCTGAAALNNCAPNPLVNDGSYALTSGANANGNTISSLPSWIYDSLANIVGKFTLQFDGSWNVSPGGPVTNVPEPGMFGLFAMAAGALAWRRRRGRAIG